MLKQLHCISSARETLNNFIVCASFIAFEFSKQAENKLTTSPQPFAMVACNHILRVGTYTNFNKARFIVVRQRISNVAVSWLRLNYLRFNYNCFYEESSFKIRRFQNQTNGILFAIVTSEPIECSA